MTRRNQTLLSVAVAVFLTAILVGSVWFSYYAGTDPQFSLPPPLPSGAPPDNTASGSSAGISGWVPVTVDALNAQTLLAALERPAAYTQIIECRAYWPGGELLTTHVYAVREGIARIETHQDASVQNRIVTNNRVYIWSGGVQPLYEISPEDMDAESQTGIPTWEDVVFLPPERILEASFASLPTGRRLYFRARQEVYEVSYTLSLETGLLLQAVYYDGDGEIAYHYEVSKTEVGDPGDHFFTLPDGRIVTEEPV